MALLKSVNDRPGINFVDYRDQLYYSKYDYRCRITVEGLRRGYYFTPDEFEKRLSNKSGYRLWGRVPNDELKVIKQNLDSIKKVLQFRIDNKKNKDITFRCEFNTIAIFSNDLQLLHDTFDNIPNSTVDYTQVETAGYSGVKLFTKEPKHKFRVYFKSRRIGEDFRGKLNDILSKNKQLRPSPGLKQWLSDNDNRQSWNWWANWLNSTHFIDYNDESYLSYLHLLYGDVLGKKYKLEKRPDPV